MLGKDLERYPHRFIELYAAMVPKLESARGLLLGA